MTCVELVLVISKPGENRERIVASALKFGLAPICCTTLKDAQVLLPQNVFRLVLCQDILSDGDFRSVIRLANTHNHQVPVIVLSYSTDWDSYLKALGLGAFDYIVCPPNPVEAEMIISSALTDPTEGEKGSSTAV